MRNKKAAPKINEDPEWREAARAELDRLLSKVHAAKVAYLSRTPLDGALVEYEDLRKAAEDYVRASYEYQKAVFGKIRVRIPVSKILR